MSITKIASLVFSARQKELDRHYHDAEALQNHVLHRLIERARDTEYGINHLFSSTKNYEQFAQNVPVNTYEELKNDIDRMRHGEHDVLWPGRVERPPRAMVP